MSKLFSPLRLRGIEFRNRVFVSPMCQYSCTAGVPSEWHLVHLGSRAVGGAALVMTEASAVVPEGRISPDDAGIWNEPQIKAWTPIAGFIKQQGAVPGMQLAHAGRKASTHAPWRGQGMVDERNGGWPVQGPSALTFSDQYRVPRAMTHEDIGAAVRAFAAAARHALEAGFQVVEIHAAHGYLLHQFLSPLANRRDDDYGGPLENRMRFPLEVIAAVRAVWPAHLPLFLRISATDWKAGGWDVEQSVAFCRHALHAGVDLVDVSSGGVAVDQRVLPGPGYQVPLARTIRAATGACVGAVGLITESRQAERILLEESADAVFLARALLRDPYWPLRAARELGVEVKWPDPYLRAL
jgi:2,4-dienoyl-CoA reductase-like NADH-dependent reductase (Old Yellow Enzyme family)